MQNPKMNEIITAWQQRTETDSPFSTASFCVQAIRLLAQGQAVSIERLVAATNLSVDKLRINQGRAL